MIAAFIIIGILLLLISILCALIYAMSSAYEEESMDIDFTLEEWRNPFL